MVHQTPNTKQQQHTRLKNNNNSSNDNNHNNNNNSYKFKAIADITFTMADLMIAGLLSTDFSLACPCESTLVDDKYSPKISNADFLVNDQ